MSEDPCCWVVDANVILRYLLRDHAVLSPKALAIIESLETGDITAFLDPVTLSEVVYVMRSVYKLPSPQISKSVAILLQLGGLVLPDKPRYLLALDLFAGPVPHFGDACACAAAILKCQGRLLSFDEGLDGLEGVARAEEPTA